MTAALRLKAGALLLAAIWLSACGGDDREGAEGVLRSLPAYRGATLVWEYDYEEDGRHVYGLGYASVEPIEQAVNNVTEFYMQWFEERAWTVVQPVRASYTAWVKDGMHVLLVRAGPEVQDPPSGYRAERKAATPSGTRFYFTLEVSE